MSNKSNLINALKAYDNLLNSTYKQISRIRANDCLTDEGKAKQIVPIMNEATKNGVKCESTVLKAVDDGLEALETKWKLQVTKTLSDAGYQTGLANFMEMLKIGAIAEREDVESAMSVFKNDRNAMSAIKNILISSTNDLYKDISYTIPADTRAKNRKLLDKVRINVIGLNYLLQELPTTVHHELAYEDSITRLNVTGLIDTVTDRFNDELELISEY